MEDPKALIKTMLASFDGTEIKRDIAYVVTQHKEHSAVARATKDALIQEISSLTRTNAQLEAEIQQISLTQSKNSDAYARKSGERYKMAQKMIELEQRNEDLESQVQELTAKVLAKEEEIQNISSPSAEALYYEIIRGFGVSFVSKEGLVYARIRNREKNDMYDVLLNEGSVEEICNAIWDLME